MNDSTVNPSSVITPGAGGLPKLTLAAADGSRAEVYLHGATVVSWQPAGDGERLFLSRVSHFAPGEPIRGGVPLVFPQFGNFGPLVQHGFARRMSWEFVGANAGDTGVSATLRLQDNEETLAAWPYHFRAELIVAIGGRGLSMTLAVTNTGDQPCAFTTALHTYLAVTALAATHVEGLAGCRYRDRTLGGAEATQDAAPAGFPGEVDRIYLHAPAELRLVESARTTTVRSAGFPDAVVWNPGAVKCATIADLEPADYLRFVCVEAAAVGAPVALAPGQRWQGTQTLVA